jgi:hypothetical protein
MVLERVLTKSPKRSSNYIAGNSYIDPTDNYVNSVLSQEPKKSLLVNSSAKSISEVYSLASE